MTQGFQIAHPTAADLPELGEFHATAWKWCYRGILDDQFLESLTGPTFSNYHRTGFDPATGALKNPAMPCLIARDTADSRIVGFVKGGATRAIAPTGDALPIDMPARFAAELYAIYVRQDWLGRGVGRRLFADWLAAIAALGHHSLCVWVLEGNHLGRSFYERCGGELVAGTDHPLTLGGKGYIEIAYAWPDITTLRRRLATA